MADRTIGLRIELNGFRGVITNIKQLEDEIRKAKEDLQELEIGSTLFQELTGQIQKAETEMGKLRKQTEGISTEKQMEGFGKLAAGITSGFAAATAAVSLFGSENEEMSKAAVQAQNLITIALSARGLMEVQVGAQIVATTIATKAETAANYFAAKSANVFNTSMKALFTTIAANPIGALVAVIGLAITAMVAFSDETEKSVVDMAKLESTISESAVKLETYTAILNSSNTSEQGRLQAIKELNKEMPGFNALLDESGRLTDEGNTYIANRVKLLNLQAQSQAYNNALAQINTEILLNQNKPLEEQLDIWDKLEGAVAWMYFGDFGKAVSDGTNAVENMTEANRGLEKQQKAVQTAISGVNEEIAKLEEENAKVDKKVKDRAKAEADAKNKKDETNKATKAQIKNNYELGKSLDNLKAQYADELEAIKKLIEITQQNVPEPEILKRLRDIKTARESLTPETFEKQMEKFGLAFVQTSTGVIALGDSMMATTQYTKQLQDEFGNFYAGFEKDITNLFLQLDFEAVNKKIQEGLAETNRFFKEGLLTEDAYVQVSQLIAQYQSAVKLAQDDPMFAALYKNEGEATAALTSINELIGIQLELEGAYGELSKKEREDLLAADTTYVGVIKQKTLAIEDYQKKLYESYLEEGKISKKKLETEIKNADLTAEQREALLLKLREMGEGDMKTFAEDIAKLRAEGFVTVVETIARGEATIIKFNQEFNKLMASGTTATQETAVRLILSNMEGYVSRIEQRGKTAFKDIKTERERIAELEKVLAADGIETDKMTYKEKLALLQAFIDAEENMMTESEVRKAKAFEKTIEGIQFAMEKISSSMSEIASITAQRFQISLQKLTNDYQNDMENIVGDTAEANQKRLELEEAYQAEKKKLEKQAQITALKFSMAQAIADGAQAVLNILATHAANPILAGVLIGVSAGITAYQVDTINQQLQMVQSMRRGGILARGGLASGPSHEQGGIYAGGGSFIEGNEAIINRQSTLQYAGLLSQVNMAGGGRPIMVQSPMDSRLVEALAKTNQEPIRAYVVERDITKAQSINQRLEQLASF